MTVTRYPDEAREDALDLRRQGWGFQRISTFLGIPKSTIKRWVDPGYSEVKLEIDRLYREHRRRPCPQCGTLMATSGDPKLCDACHRAAVPIWTLESIGPAIRYARSVVGRPLRRSDFMAGGLDDLPSPSTLRALGFTPAEACKMARVAFQLGQRGRPRKDSA